MSNRSYLFGAGIIWRVMNYFQFPVGMSNRSYVLEIKTQNKGVKMVFQFPVGMSNRSYYGDSELEVTALVHFQFPVGMSNRSYSSSAQSDYEHAEDSFNSPWECRIGLTDEILEPLFSFFFCFFQFPVGMSNRSYGSAPKLKLSLYSHFQFPVGMSNRSY